MCHLKTILSYFIIGYALLFATLNVTAQTPDSLLEIVRGGQFKDLILPMPIIERLSFENIWGGQGVIPRDVDNGVEGETWCYWGGNPMLGKDGQYHIAICRWKEETGHWGWPDSEVAHAVSKNVYGPYHITGTILPKAHNPEVVALNDGSFILHISGGTIYRATDLAGPWNLLGKIKIDTRGHKGLSNLYTNLTGLQRKDGSFLFFTKSGGVMISNTGLLGTYKMVSANNYDRYSGYPEDPVIWRSQHQYHVIYNHAVDKKSVHMRSLDGINWKIEPGVPYDQSIFKYTDGTGNEWCKFERPKVVQDRLGRATNLSLAVIDVEKQLDLGNDKHSSKNVVLPLITERIIEMVNTETITEQTQKVIIRVKAEENFDPKEIDIQTLRFGTSEVVNAGGGLEPESFKIVEGDLELSFNWNLSALTDLDYDLKLLGTTISGVLVYGYALLPQQKEDPATLVLLPVTIEDNRLKTEVQNFGLQKSVPSKLMIFKLFNGKRESLAQFDIKALEPYEVMKVECPVNVLKNIEYEAIVVTSKEDQRFWKKVDDTHSSIVFKGQWKRSSVGDDLYMHSEQMAIEQGASATFVFRGTQARCYGHISRNMGSYNVFIDGLFVESIDCYGVDLQNVVIYQTGLLPEGLHELKLVATGKHYKGNEQGPVSIDAFSYIN